jgi:A/G-specific adenine glycosylase
MANSVELIIFNQPAPLLDVNMARVLERFFGERKLADIRYDPGLQDLARKVVSVARSKELNWAILDYATLVCKARRPACEICQLSSKCTYYNQQ